MKKLFALLSVLGVSCSSVSSVFSCAKSGPVTTTDIEVSYGDRKANTNDVNYFSTSNTSLYELSYGLLNILTFSENKYTSAEFSNDFKNIINKDVIEKYSIESLKSDKTNWKEFKDDFQGENYNDTIKSFTFCLGDKEYSNYTTGDSSLFNVYNTTKNNDTYDEKEETDVKKIDSSSKDEITSIWSSFDIENQKLIGKYENYPSKYSIKKSTNETPSMIDMSTDNTIYLSSDGKSLADSTYYLSSESYEVIMDYYSSNDKIDYEVTFTLSGMVTTFNAVLKDSEDGNSSNIYLIPSRYLFNKNNRIDKEYDQYDNLKIEVANVKEHKNKE